MHGAVARDIARDADALSARVRTGISGKRGPLQALVESEATLAIVERYNSGTNGLTGYPLVVDPQNIELNRAQLRYAAHAVTLVVGRQQVELADQRFVGSAKLRQNQQTYDAARFQWGDPGHVFADVSYASSARTVSGIDGTPARPKAIGGDKVFALVGARTPVGTLTGLGYLVDRDGRAVQNFARSSQTYGVRLTDSRKIGHAAGVGWQLCAAERLAPQPQRLCRKILAGRGDREHERRVVHRRVRGAGRG